MSSGMLPVDQRTLFELQILAEHGRSVSVLDYFDKTKTYGGRDYLKTMISKPKNTLPELLSFQEVLKAIASQPHRWEIDVPRAYIMAAEGYYSLNVAHSMSQDIFKHWMDTLIFSFRNPEEFYRIQSGLMAVLRLIRAINQTLTSLEATDLPQEIAEEVSHLQKFLAQSTVKSLLKHKKDNLSNQAVFYLDYFFRVRHKKELRQLLDFFYRLDAYVAIVKTAALHNLTYPSIGPNIDEFSADTIKHPLIVNPVPNCFDLHKSRPVCILTGANTSGKTTFLKTCGIIVYLAHLGWPVPAKNVRMPFFDQLFTSIHLSDDLALGFSHFYNEVMLIKQMAQALHDGNKCFIIIDELFRGTNQDDSLYCSKAVLDGFSNFQDSLFLVSTHLLKLIEDQMQSPRITLKCFKTKITGQQFENLFQIEPGISFEKVGSLIMNQSGIIELFMTNKKSPHKK